MPFDGFQQFAAITYAMVFCQSRIRALKFFFVPYETSNIGCDGKRHSAFGSPKVFEPNEMSAAVLLPQHLH